VPWLLIVKVPGSCIAISYHTSGNADETSTANVKWRKPDAAKVADVADVIRVKTCEKCRQSEQFRLSTLMSTATVS